MTKAAFAPFGELIALPRSDGKSANQGTAQRFDWQAQLTSLRPHARANLALFAARARTLPVPIPLLERHPGSTQLFVPMAVGRYLVIVAPTLADGEPSWSEVVAFVCGASQAINYHAGTWHHPFIAIERDAELAMLVWEDESAGDCEERPAPPSLQLVVTL